MNTLRGAWAAGPSSHWLCSEEGQRTRGLSFKTQAGPAIVTEAGVLQAGAGAGITQRRCWPGPLKSVVSESWTLT